MIRTRTFTALLALSCVAEAAVAVEPVAQNKANKDFLARNYPPASLQRGEYGKVGFQLTIEADGLLAGCAITQSSGFAGLDRGTCEMLVNSAKLEAAVDKDGRKVRTYKNGYVTWKLPAGVQPAIPAKADPAAKVDPLVCRRESITGSIVKTGIRCMSPAEWIREERYAQQKLDKLQTELGCTDHGC